ncbi:PaaI family thioesterase [Nocardia sp. BMG111209]|uniref:PaaI family thioesterase n=1 Tax=Nocardia sp. BMG111209 TaxID=1160137 RepID=UPI000363722D|nr:PaaI family thioesterase [Nocardia sp. BMG111209]
MPDTTLSPAQEARLRDSIGRQTLLTTLGIGIASLAPGRVVLELPFRADLCQQNGFVHAGAITTLADSACGYAAMSLQPPDRDILTVEFKVNLMSPAVGQRFLATATVVRSGRTLTVCTAEVTAGAEDTRPVALMQATLMAVPSA